MLTYRDEIELPGETTLDTARIIEEHLRGFGRAGRNDQRLAFELEADDLWQLRDTLAEIEGTLASHGIVYMADREKVEGEATRPPAPLTPADAADIVNALDGLAGLDEGEHTDSERLRELADLLRPHASTGRGVFREREEAGA